MGPTAPASPEVRAAAVDTIDFLREEVAAICAALALGESLLRRLGLGPEAARLEALFSAVESRLARRQPAEDSEDSTSGTASSFLSWS